MNSSKYSKQELKFIYSLSITYLETGNYHKSHQLLSGLVEVAPTDHNFWIALSVCQLLLSEADQARLSAHQALRLQPNSVRAKLLIITLFLNISEYSEAGTYLGEIKDLVTSGETLTKDVTRYFDAQLARFEFLLNQNQLQKSVDS